MTTAFAHTRDHEGHYQAGHPERPERLQVLLERLRTDDAWNAVHHLEPYPADIDDVLRVHTPEHVEHVQQVVSRGPAQLDADTYATPTSLNVALRALGDLLGVTDAVLEGVADNGFAAVRPPGHHATPDQSMGFCLFSNAAIAARWAQEEHGLNRILIVDFDVHHGNGTQDVFYDDCNVMYMSTHQHPLYPGTGGPREKGSDYGKGATVNIPLPPSTGNAGYEQAFERVLDPVAHRFHPELIILSAGYDAHWKDHIAHMNVTAGGFGRLVYRIMEWADTFCDGRLVATLEGGYHADALAFSVLNTVRVLLDPEADVDDPLGVPDVPAPDISKLLDDLANLHHVS